MQTDLIASVHLGKKSLVSEIYDKSLLVAVPRIENRAVYNIDNSNLPFYGFDVWHCYEFSTMLENGYPVTKLLKLKYSAESPFIVESKSLKLYLNSFNMTKIGDDENDCIKTCKEMIENDLSELLHTKISAMFFDNDENFQKIAANYIDLKDVVDITNIKITDFKENPELLKITNSNVKEYRLKFTSLRSNCRVTHQPDFGDLFVYYKSKKHIEEESLIKYLTSFRSEYHFHEECVEMIFKRIYDMLDRDDELCVCAMYTRRGGIDINPFRCSNNCKIDDFSDLENLKKLTKGGIKQ